MKKLKTLISRGTDPIKTLSAADVGTTMTGGFLMRFANVSLPWMLPWMMRAGYVARGVVFLIIGGFALLAAGGLGADPHGARDALELLFEKPFGGYFLWALAIGLLCFAGWRLRQAVFDSEQCGTDLYGVMRRIVLAGSGLFYVALAAAAARITFEHRRVTEDQSAREWTAWAMAQPLGRAVIAAIAAGFVVFAIGLAVKTVRASHRHFHDGGAARPVWVVFLGSFGTLTRAAVFLMLGGYLAIAAYDANSREAVSLAGVLRAMRQQAYGGALLGVAALGLLAFGFFEITEAAIRRPDAWEPSAAKPKFSRLASRNRRRSASE